jgi:hypothetical protein
MSTDIFTLFHVLQLMILSLRLGRKNKFHGIVDVKNSGFHSLNPGFFAATAPVWEIWGRTDRGVPFFCRKIFLLGKRMLVCRLTNRQG